jgi:acyl-CoA thioester hydrolase
VEEETLQTLIPVTRSYKHFCHDILLTHETEVIVRFNEADPLGIVWHGHYLRYFEDGREAFGKAHGISYLDCSRQGIALPVVSVRCDYSKPLRYGDTVKVHTTFVNCAAAKVMFDYKIFAIGAKTLVAKGSSVQVFVDLKNFQLQLTLPPFFEEWKRKHNLI